MMFIDQKRFKFYPHYNITSEVWQACTDEADKTVNTACIPGCVRRTEKSTRVSDNTCHNTVDSEDNGQTSLQRSGHICINSDHLTAQRLFFIKSMISLLNVT
eukprot:UN19347